MEHVLGILRSVFKPSSSISFVSSERVSLDFRRFTEEYGEGPEHSPDALFENPRPSEPGKPSRVMDVRSEIPTILWFFLDGSRRTYKVLDVVVDRKRFLPVVAGQVGVGVMERSDGSPAHLVPRRDFCNFERVLALPNDIGKDELAHLEEVMNRKLLGGTGPRFKVLAYDVKKDKDPVDLAVAAISTHMHRLEVATVQRMAAANLLSNQRMLVLDGPLDFGGNLDVVQFRNVIGLSKSFRPSIVLGTGRSRMDVGSTAYRLGFGERTAAFKSVSKGRTIAIWYLRLRNRVSHPLQGVVKLECFAIGGEIEDGVSAERVDVVSGHVLRERNVCPFGSDTRWASHLYPVYLSEKYLKSNFMSDVAFTALF